MKIFRMLIIVLIFFAGCHKWEATTGKTEIPNDINQLVIGSDFDWRTSLNVAFYVSNADIGMIKITSTDRKTIFHKGYYNGVTSRYHIIVSIPFYLDYVLINGESVEVNANIIEHTVTNTNNLLKEIKTGSSISFNGIDDYARISNTTNGEIIKNYPYTFSVWFKTPGFNIPNEDMVIFCMADSTKGDRYSGLYIGEDEGGRAILRARKGPGDKTIYSNVVVTDNKWHQIVGVFEKKNKRSLYIDGEFIGSNTKKVDFSKQRIFNIGRWATNKPKGYFNGLIDEVQVWDKALSSSEVTAYFTESPLGTESNLKAYWKLDDASGSSFTDESGNGNIGYLIGTEWAGEGRGSTGSSGDTDGDGILNEDDDYPEDASRSFNNYFPASSFGTLAFEDLWPARGDYDFNDLVVDYQFNTVTNKENKITEVYANFVVRAIGASYQNGFGFQLPNSNLNSSNVNITGYSVLNNYIKMASNGLEASQNFPTIIVFDNAFDILPRIGGTVGVNTVPGAGIIAPDTVKIRMTFNQNSHTINDLNLVNFNPFIMINQERGKEVHLANYSPTALVEASYLATIHDDSDISSGRFYKTQENLVWAINIYESFDYPIEKSNIIYTHLKFSAWAESGGDLYPDWYLDKTDYRNIDSIYRINN